MDSLVRHIYSIVAILKQQVQCLADSETNYKELADNFTKVKDMGAGEQQQQQDDRTLSKPFKEIAESYSE